MLSEKRRDLNWSCIGPKFNLHYLQEISTGFRISVLTPKSDIGISLSTKFKLKLTILIWKIFPKSSFKSKTDKMKHPIEFCIFELIKYQFPK